MSKTTEEFMGKLEEMGFDPEFLELFKEEELFCLHQNCEAKNSIVQVTVSLDSETDLPEIFQQSKQFGQVIAHLDNSNGNRAKICFNLIFAVKDDGMTRLNGFFSGKNYIKEVKILP